MYRICKIFDIQAAHLLSKHPGRCKYPHGHNYRIEVRLEADQLDDNDMVCDFQAVHACLEDILDRLDHGLAINTADPNYPHLKPTTDRLIEFANQDPTSEVLAKWIFQALQQRLHQGGAVTSKAGTTYTLNRHVRVAAVRVWETPTCWAQYSES